MSNKTVQRYENVRSEARFIDGEMRTEQTLTTNILRKVEQEPPFVKIYINDIGRLHNLQPQTRKVLDELVRSMGYNNQVVINVGFKRQICKRLDIYIHREGKPPELGVNVIDQHINKLINSGIIQRVEKGVYLFDANLFGRGQWTDIKNIRLTIDYTEDGRIITADIKKSKISK